MPTPQLILLGLIAPALIAAIITLAGSWFSKGNPWPALVGLGIALFIGYRGIAGVWPPLPPIESPERILCFGLILIVIAILAALKAIPWPVRALVMIAAPATLVWFVFQPLPVLSLPRDQMWRLVIAATLLATIVSTSTELLAMNRPALSPALSIGPLAAGIGVLLLLMGTGKLGWMAAMIGLIILGWFFAALLNKSVVLRRGPIYIAIALLTAILTYDYFDSGSITLLEVALLCIAPLLAWIVELPPMTKWKSWKRELLRLILVTLPVAAAVVLAIIQLKKDSPNGLEM